jgi:hypothetical protein
MCLSVLKTGISSHRAQQAEAKQNFTWLVMVETFAFCVSQATDENTPLEVMGVPEVNPGLKSLNSEWTWGDVQVHKSLPDATRLEATVLAVTFGPPFSFSIPLQVLCQPTCKT